MHIDVLKYFLLNIPNPPTKLPRALPFLPPPLTGREVRRHRAKLMRPVVLLLDGGIGHELKRRGVKPELEGLGAIDDDLFVASALACLTNAAEVIEIHARYIASGCDVITTNSFVMTPHNLRQLDPVEVDLTTLVEAAIDCALEARKREGCERSVRIAGSIPGPLEESYLDATSTDDATAIAIYRELISIHASRVDLLLFETVASVRELTNILDALLRFSPSTLPPVWISMTVEDVADVSPNRGVRLRSGDELRAAARCVVASGACVEALLINCSAPTSCLLALEELQGLRTAGGQGTPLLLGAYANGFRTSTSEWLAAAAEGGEQPHDRFVKANPGDYDEEGLVTPAAYARHVGAWLARVEGLAIVGGCCGTSPDHMRELARLQKEERCVAAGVAADRGS